MVAAAGTAVAAAAADVVGDEAALGKLGVSSEVAARGRGWGQHDESLGMVKDHAG